MITAVYVRVSTVGQNEAGQRLAIERWLESNGIDNAVWYVERETGDTLDRPAFDKLRKAIYAGTVRTVVCWKLDRLSRKMRDGINILCDWCERGLRVVSVTQQIDFSGTIGRMVASLLFAVAEMEQETRRERQAAGIQAAKEAGKHWGGSTKGRRCGTTTEQYDAALRLYGEGMPVAQIARTVQVSGRTILRWAKSAGVDRPASRDA